MQRRDFMKLSCGTVLGFAVSKNGFLEVARADASTPVLITDPNPIQLLQWNQLSSIDFNGDDINRTHEALWDREGYIARKGGRPAASEVVDTVVVGGGLSGLLSAYFLKDRNPVVLEQGLNFGGNSRGEFFMGQSPFSIGAAYITKPDEGSLVHKVLENLGLLGVGRLEGTSESKVLWRNQFYEGFWKGQTAPEAQQQFQQVYQHLAFILENFYPEIPPTPGSALTFSELMQLDQLTFKDWLTQNFGVLHPHILEYFQLYCWSSFGGSIEELSAAQAINFLAAETEAVVAFPGGNATITQALYNDMQKDLGGGVLRAGHLVLDVQLDNEGVLVCYETPQRELRTLRARHCVMASPKFVAKRIVSSMSAEQAQACDRIDYRAYVVANVFVDTRRIKTLRAEFSPCFDLYALEGETPPAPSALRPPHRAFTDVCFGSWAQGDRGDLGILTVYKPLPYQGARQFLFNPMSHNKYLSSIQSGIQPLLQQLGVQAQEILGVRLTRWGHALPLAERGAIASGHLEKASAPIGGRIFFANQDNWANPSFEAAIEAAHTAALSVRA